MYERRIRLTAVLILSLVITSAQAGSIVDQQLKHYKDLGAGQANPTAGEKLWYMSNGDRSCTTCHGNTPADQGQHVKTRKLIKPMAPTVNLERFQDLKKIEKWFLRNCKWTYGRVCTPQEKTDILSWLASQ